MTNDTKVELEIGGMTCASCAARITKRLNKLDGVEANVNYATERAAITVHDPSLSTEKLIEQVEAIGYTAKVPPALHDPLHVRARRGRRRRARAAHAAPHG